MRPDRRFGIGGPRLAAAWLLVAASAAMARGQDWKAEPLDPNGHSSDVVAEAISLDGKTLATGGLDGLAKVWDLGLGKLTHRANLVGHDGKVLAVAISSDGKLVVTGGADRTVRLWDAAKGTPLATLKGHSGAVEALALSPDGKTLASGGLDTSIRLWDVAGRQLSKTIQGHEQGVRGLAFAADGKSLASASRDHSVKLWDVIEGTERATLGQHQGPAWCVAFSPDGKSVASGGLDRTVRLWRVPEVEPQPIQPRPQPGQPGADVGRRQDAELTARVRVLERLENIRSEVPDVVFVQQPRQPEGPRPVQLGGGMGGGFIQVQQDSPNPPQPNQAGGWPAEGDVVAVAFAPDGRYVAAAISDLKASPTTPGSVVFFGIPFLTPKAQSPIAPAPRPTIRGHLGPIWALAFGPGGKEVVTVGGDASIRAWDAVAAKPLVASIGVRDRVPVEERVMNHLDPVEALAISPDGKRVATATESAGVSLWDATTRLLIGRLRDPAGPVRALALSPDGKVLATGGDGKAVSLWDATTGLPIDKLKGHVGAITALGFSPDGRTLASGSKDASVSLWDVGKKAEIVTLSRHTSAIAALAFSPDGKVLATAGLDYSVKLWEVPSGQYRDTLDGHKDVVDALAFNPDGSTLASGDRTGTIRFWDAAGRAERLAIPALSGPVRALAFAPDGRTLVGGGDDRSIRRWGSRDGKVVAIQSEAHLGPIRALAFGPGGKTLATAGADRELKLWDVDARLAPRPFAGIEGKVRQLAVSPDGKTLATASADHLVKLWDVATGHERTPPIPFQGDEIRLAFSPDGKTLAIVPVKNGSDAPKLWDVGDGTMKGSSAQATDDGWDVAFAPDGKSWATTHKDTVHLWGLGFNRQARDFAEAAKPIRSLAFSPDGTTIAAGLVDGAVTLWDAADNKKVRAVFQPSTKAIAVLAFSPDSRSIAIGGSDRGVRVLDAAIGEVRLTVEGPRRPITGLAFSPDGRTIASAADGEPTLFAWDAASGDVVSNPMLLGASGREGLACLAFAPDGKVLFAGGERGVIAFDMTPGHRPPSLVAPAGSRRGQELATLRGHAEDVRSLAFVEGGSKLVTRSADFVVKVWDLLDHNRDRFTFGGTDFKAQSMALSPDGKSLAVGLRLPPAARPRPDEGEEPAQEPKPKAEAPAQKFADEVKVWDLETGESRGTISGRATTGGADRVVALAYSKDGRTLATASQAQRRSDTGGIVRTWDAASLEAKVDMAGRASVTDIVQFSPDGRTLLGANGSGLVTLWDAETGQIRASFTHQGGINQVFISPDGKRVATGGGNAKLANGAPADGLDGPGSGGDVRLWDLATGRRVAVLPMPSGRVTRLAFSRDGKMLAASTEGSVATAWDVAEAAPIVSLAWPGGEAKYLAFSPDGRALATAGDDEVLRVWDIPAGTLRAGLLGHADGINWVAFSPDGRTLATASKDATVKLWAVPPARSGPARP